MQENIIFSRNLNSKIVKSHLPLHAKKFRIYAPTNPNIFNFNMVLFTLPKNKDGELLVSDCNDSCFQNLFLIRMAMFILVI